MNSHQIRFDEDLVRRYDRSGPRYTSYPTAVQFSDRFGVNEYRAVAVASNQDPIPRPLSPASVDRPRTRQDVSLVSRIFLLVGRRPFFPGSPVAPSVVGIGYRSRVPALRFRPAGVALPGKVAAPEVAATLPSAPPRPASTGPRRGPSPSPPGPPPPGRRFFVCRPPYARASPGRSWCGGRSRCRGTRGRTARSGR